MDTDVHCLNCRQDLTADRAAGLTYCSRCGCGLPELEPAKPPPPAETDPNALTALERKRLRICFWTLFLVTPISLILMGTSEDWLDAHIPGALSGLLHPFVRYGSTFLAGLFSASYCLSKLLNASATQLERIPHVILLAFGLFIAYLGILFVGCMFVLPFARW